MIGRDVIVASVVKYRIGYVGLISCIMTRMQCSGGMTSTEEGKRTNERACCK